METEDGHIKYINKCLMFAINNGNLERTRKLINDFGLSYSAAWSDGYFLLCNAVKGNHTEVVNLLLTNGSKVNIESVNPTNTPLHFAVKRINIEIVKLLLEKGAKIDAENEDGRTPLHISAEIGNFQIVDILLNYGACVNSVCSSKLNIGYTSPRYGSNGRRKQGMFHKIRYAKANAKGKDNITPLHIAAKMGYIKVAEILLKHGACVNSVCSSKWNRGYAPLHYAVEHQHNEVIELLLSRGACVDVEGEDNITPLHIAAKMGYVDVAEILLNHGAFINPLTLQYKYTPLHFALKQSYVEAVILTLFVNRGADVNAKTKSNLTPLHIATKRRLQFAVKLLLQHGAKVDNRDGDGKTILRLSVEEEDLPIVKDILKYCPDIRDHSNRSSLKIALLRNTLKKIVEVLLQYGLTLNPEDSSNPELLHAAVENKYLKIVEDLLKNGANVNTLSGSRGSGLTPLQTASINGLYEVAELLIRYGANVNAEDQWNKTALFYAIMNDDSKMIKLLSTNGANAKKNPELLITAVEMNCMKLVETILEHGADINASDRYGRTALHFVALDERTDKENHHIAKLLLSKGANVDAQTKYGDTTLHAACRIGHTKVAEVLLDHNANIDIESRDNTTLLHLSVEKRMKEIPTLLLNKGADVNSKKKDGTTALHIAAQTGNQEVVVVLIQRGADIDSKDVNGKTPLHLASIKGHEEAVITLLDYGADVNITCRNHITSLEYAMIGINLSAGPFRHNSGAPAEVLKRHILQIKNASLYLCEQNLRSIESFDDTQFQNQCEKEIKKMNMVTIEKTNISFYDLLSKSENLLAVYMRNENTVKTLTSVGYKRKFPIYGNTMKNNLKKAVKRSKLLEQGHQTSHFLLNNFSEFELPYLCVEKIFSYLSDEELKNFMVACKN